MRRYKVDAVVNGKHGLKTVCEVLIADSPEHARKIVARHRPVVRFLDAIDMTDAVTGWDHVAFVRSRTEPDEIHEIRKRASTGMIGCDCKSYQFSKGTKTCHHLEALNLANAAPAIAVEQTVHVSSKIGRGRSDTFTVTRRAISLGPLTMKSVGGAR